MINCKRCGNYLHTITFEDKSQSNMCIECDRIRGSIIKIGVYDE